MRNMACAALVLIALPCCAHAAEPDPVLAGPVNYEVRSWGRIILRWEVKPDGSGEIWRGRPGKGAGEVRKFRLRLPDDALRTFARNLEDVREVTKGGVTCDKEIYDLPYGTITWDYPGGKQGYAFDAGCRSEEADEVMDILGAANSVLENMAAIDAKPYVTEHVEPR
ncbi:MAG TPA: hypothetical protein VGE05_03590 [Novosphingobium sp.]